MKLADWIERESPNGKTRAWLSRELNTSNGRVTQLCNGEWPGKGVAQKILELTGGEVGPNDWLEPVAKVDA